MADGNQNPLIINPALNYKAHLLPGPSKKPQLDQLREILVHQNSFSKVLNIFNMLDMTSYIKFQGRPMSEHRNNVEIKKRRMYGRTHHSSQPVSILKPADEGHLLFQKSLCPFLCLSEWRILIILDPL